LSISALIFYFRVASNAKIIPRKSKKSSPNPDIPFLGLQLSAILTFEKKFGKMHIAMTMLHFS